jgi:hypothetical protein
MNYPGAVDAVEVCERLRSWDIYRRTAEIEGIVSQGTHEKIIN